MELVLTLFVMCSNITLQISMRVYRHLNPDNLDAHPKHSTRSLIASPSDVLDWLARIDKHPICKMVVTVTFIVDTEGWLWIADRHSEHVACATGHDVLSAGEMTFEIDEHNIAVSEVTNQSLGYCPEPDSWPAVASALERAGIHHPGCFTAEFLFRKCSECATKNIIKDSWYECGVCGSLLSQTWNFMDK
ncbi:MAG: hypothetical protein AB1489_32060 [Acidobacteriota bacterium]